MAGWELALVMVAFTYMMVNTVYLIIMVKTMSDWKGVMQKSLKLMEKLMEKSEKAIDELYEDL